MATEDLGTPYKLEKRSDDGRLTYYIEQTHYWMARALRAEEYLPCTVCGVKKRNHFGHDPIEDVGHEWRLT